MKWMRLDLFYEKVTLESQKSHDHRRAMFRPRCQFPLPVVLTRQLAFKRGRRKTKSCYRPSTHTHGPAKTWTNVKRSGAAWDDTTCGTLFRLEISEAHRSLMEMAEALPLQWVSFWFVPFFNSSPIPPMTR